MVAAAAMACGAGSARPVSVPPAARLADAGRGFSCAMTELPATPLAPPALDRGAGVPSRANLGAWVRLLADPALTGRATTAPATPRRGSTWRRSSEPCGS